MKFSIIKNGAIVTIAALIVASAAFSGQPTTIYNPQNTYSATVDSNHDLHVYNDGGSSNATTTNATIVAPLGTQVVANSLATTVTQATHAQCAALCTSLVAKASPGILYSFNVSADSTLSAAAWWVLIYDATSKPGDGSVTPAKCYAMPSGATGLNGAFDAGGVAFATGITFAVSTTGCFTSTSSTHAAIGVDYQ